jgi:hypothetical protein
VQSPLSSSLTDLQRVAIKRHRGLAFCPVKNKASGCRARIGREGSKYGIEEFLEVKYLCMGGIDR